MRFLFRKIAVVSSAAILIFFCSCERHHPDELPVEEHAQSETANREHAEHANKHGRDQNHPDDQSRATTAMSVTPPPASPAATPAEFFPENSPH